MSSPRPRFPRPTRQPPDDDDDEGRQAFIRDIARQSGMPRAAYLGDERRIARVERRRLMREHEHPHEWRDYDEDDDF